MGPVAQASTGGLDGSVLVATAYFHLPALGIISISLPDSFSGACGSKLFSVHGGTGGIRGPINLESSGRGLLYYIEKATCLPLRATSLDIDSRLPGTGTDWAASVHFQIA